MEIEKEITLWVDQSGNLLAKMHDFFAIVPAGTFNLIEMGLDAIREDCLRLSWEMFDPSSPEKWNNSAGQAIREWAIRIDREWTTL